MKSPGAIRSARWRAAHKEVALARGRMDYHAKRDVNVAKKRAYNAARRDEINAKCRAYEALHRDKKLARGLAYREANREILREKDRQYARANPAGAAARAMKHIAARLQAMPAWTDQTAIKAFYREAARRTRETGIPHDVDHIYPLQGRTVCGLHVAWNLRVITQSENCRKSNKFPVSIAS